MVRNLGIVVSPVLNMGTFQKYGERRSVTIPPNTEKKNHISDTEPVRILRNLYLFFSG